MKNYRHRFTLNNRKYIPVFMLTFTPVIYPIMIMSNYRKPSTPTLLLSQLSWFLIKSLSVAKSTSRKSYNNKIDYYHPTKIWQLYFYFKLCHCLIFFMHCILFIFFLISKWPLDSSLLYIYPMLYSSSFKRKAKSKRAPEQQQNTHKTK